MSATKRRPVKRNTRSEQKSSLSESLQTHRRIASNSARKLLRTPASTFVTLFVIAVALLLPALLFSLNSNITSLLSGFEDEAQITLYLRDGLSEQEGSDVSNDLLTRNGISSVEYVSSAQALDEFGAATGLENLLSQLPANPLPAAIIITPADVSPSAVEELAQELGVLDGVAEIRLDSRWLQRLAAISDLLATMGSLLSAIVVLGLFFIVGNTIKLAVENRKAEIRVIKLVGGSDLFAARPFLYTGALYGLGGGVLAAVLQVIVLTVFNTDLEALMSLYESDFQLRGFGLGSATMLVLSGCIIGWIAALVASLRHIRGISP